MPAEPREARTRRCPSPSPTTVKELFGTATQCGRPDCNQSLYRSEGGRPALNCEIAHIRASAPNGPRADPMMTCSEVNAFDNLLLLCDYDARLIDTDWEAFPVELLAEWKAEQVRQATDFGAVRPPTDDEIAQLLVRSAEHGSAARSALVDFARSVRRLRSAAERTRSEPQQILLERQRAIRDLNRAFVGFDPETGERLEAQLSRADERRFEARIADALRRSHGSVESAADTVHADAAGVAAAAGSTAIDARGWVDRSVAEVVKRSLAWGDGLDEALDQLDAAAAALADAVEGRPTSVPPPPAPPVPPEPTPFELFRDRVLEVNERAARHRRVDHLPFDPDVHRALLDLAPGCSAFPTVPSFLPYSLDQNAGLAAATLKNADDEQFALAVDLAESLQPEVAAAFHLRQLHFFVDDEHGRSHQEEHVDAARHRLSELIIVRLGAADFWMRNREHGASILLFAEGTVGADDLESRLRNALDDPAVVDPMLIALSETVEVRDSSTHEFLRIERRFSEAGGPLECVPPFVPVDAICAAIERRWPDGARGQDSEAERLAVEFRQHRCS